jgi:hypothetical protein
MVTELKQLLMPRWPSPKIVFLQLMIESFAAFRENHRHFEIFTLQQPLAIECTYLEAEET